MILYILKCDSGRFWLGSNLEFQWPQKTICPSTGAWSADGPSITGPFVAQKLLYMVQDRGGPLAWPNMKEADQQKDSEKKHFET